MLHILSEKKMYAHADLELQWLHVIFNAAFIWRDSYYSQI